MAPRKGCVPWSWKVRRQAVRPGRLQGSRTISDFQAAFPRPNRALQQAKRLGAEILVTRSVQRIDPASREVFLDGDDVVHARTVILATGVSWRKLAIKDVDRLIGKGISYGAARSEAVATSGLDVHLIGAGNSAGQAALNFANHARMVTLIVRGDSLEKSMSQYLIEQLHRKSNIAVQLQSGRSMATRT